MIELRKVSKSFGSRTVLNNINLTIYPNEITYIVGTSGAGKTTMLNIIGGLLSADSGKVFVDGNDISDNLDRYRSKTVGFIFQDFNLISGLSIQDNIKVGQYYSGVIPSTEDNEKMLSILSDLDLNKSDQKVETLSGGEKQRTAFARSIIKKSRIIIADEPTGNLDSINADKVLDLLARSKKGRHIIVVSHDMEKARKYADRIIEIADGVIFRDTYLQNHNGINSEATFVQGEEKNTAVFRASFMLGMNSIRRRFGKILSIVLVIAIAISALTLVISISNWGNTVTTRVNKYYLETDLVSLTYPINSNPHYTSGKYPFSQKDIKGIEEKYATALVVPQYYAYADTELSIGKGANICRTSFKQVILNEDFKERILSFDIEGTFPENDYEIIIASDVSKTLFSGGGIGERVQLHTENGNSVEFKVVGINHTTNPYDNVYTIVSAFALKSLLEKDIQTELEGIVNVSEVRDVPNSVTTGGLKGNLIVCNDSVHILQGRLPSNEQEIVISTFLAENFWGRDWADNLEDLFATKYNISLNGSFEISICGVFDSKDMSLGCVESLVDAIGVADPVCLDVYLPDSMDTASVYAEINEEGRYFCTYALEKLKSQVDGQTGFFKTAIMIVGVILTLISVALLNSFSKITILERKHELAIIKCLGARDGDLMSVLMFDSSAIAAAAVTLSAIITGIGNSILPAFFGDLSYIDFSYPLAAEVITGLSFSLLILVCTAFHFRKVAKKMPAELLTDS